MSLFDRYDQNKAESFLRNACFVSTSQRRFEDLFEQIPTHYSYKEIFSNSEECLKNKDAMMKSLHRKCVIKNYKLLIKSINSIVSFFSLSFSLKKMFPWIV